MEKVATTVGSGPGADIKIIVLYLAYFLCVTFLTWKSPTESPIRTYAKELYGIGIVSLTLVLLSIQLPTLPHERTARIVCRHPVVDKAEAAHL